MMVLQSNVRTLFLFFLLPGRAGRAYHHIMTSQVRVPSAPSISAVPFWSLHFRRGLPVGRVALACPGWESRASSTSRRLSAKHPKRNKGGRFLFPVRFPFARPCPSPAVGINFCLKILRTAFGPRYTFVTSCPASARAHRANKEVGFPTCSRQNVTVMAATATIVCCLNPGPCKPPMRLGLERERALNAWSLHERGPVSLCGRPPPTP